MRHLPPAVRLALVASTLLVAAGCNPHGTCLQRAYDKDLGDRCVINYFKRPCVAQHGQFFKENSAAGLLRCKTGGYNPPSGDKYWSSKLEKGDTVIFYKPTAAQPKQR